ncbi:protein S40-5-like [Mercurialis annua]|uniref:protein S40-5-like n=1 Tax=Mercurialis annua TaxID=3986 RepID=UPI00215DFD63|nr:protein S40-5-like [Mercurialis annua]
MINMASKKMFAHAKRASSSYIFVNPEAETSQVISHSDDLFDFDEADLWSNNNNNNNSSGAAVSRQFEVKKKLPRKGSSGGGGGGGGGRNMVMARTPVSCASSLPVNVPDWSKIYRVVDHRGHNDNDNNLDDQESDYELDLGDHGGVHGGGGGDHDIRVPIHEYLARRRGASFSVHEGIGRTLKGRDLRQVRNAIWKQVGFED